MKVTGSKFPGWEETQIILPRSQRAHLQNGVLWRHRPKILIFRETRGKNQTKSPISHSNFAFTLVILLKLGNQITKRLISWRKLRLPTKCPSLHYELRQIVIVEKRRRLSPLIFLDIIVKLMSVSKWKACDKKIFFSIVFSLEWMPFWL